MNATTGTFTTLRRALAPMTWAEIVTVVTRHAREQGIRWDDAARNLATAATEERTSR
jgi:hypothetical protein